MRSRTDCMTKVPNTRLCYLALSCVDCMPPSPRPSPNMKPAPTEGGLRPHPWFYKTVQRHHFTYRCIIHHDLVHHPLERCSRVFMYARRYIPGIKASRGGGCCIFPTQWIKSNLPVPTLHTQERHIPSLRDAISQLGNISHSKTVAFRYRV